MDYSYISVVIDSGFQPAGFVPRPCGYQTIFSFFELVFYPAEEEAIRVIPKKPDKARPAANVVPLVRGAKAP